MGVVVGIDLGTTSSRVAVVQDGRPIIIENSEGEGTTPSYVAFTKSGEVLVGEAARRQAIANHENTIYAVKRLIGRRYQDPVIDPIKRILPYTIIEAGSGDAWVEVRGRAYSPQEISSFILRKLKEAAEAFLGEAVTQAVITVPAYFNNAQRQATKDAGTLAGLEVLRIIHEPTAAAVAYGLASGKSGKVAVYDLGGGTFDVSILELGDGVFEVKSTNGDTFLGGEDFDLKLVEYVANEFSKAAHIEIWSDRIALQRLKEAAEVAKIDLSSQFNASIRLPFLVADKFGSRHLDTVISREKFEKLVGDLVERTIHICSLALKDADLTIRDISEVVLVGGSTRIPLVTEQVSRFFKRIPHKGVRREDAVALGAAIEAGVLSGLIKNVLLLDATSLSLGIETLGGVFTPLISRNTTIPTKKSQIFSTAEDGQAAVTITVLQGDGELANDNKLLAKFDLLGIPPAPRGVPQIEVTFDIDVNDILNVKAKDKGTGKEQFIRVRASGGLSDDEIKTIIAKRSTGEPTITTNVQSTAKDYSVGFPAPAINRTAEIPRALIALEDAPAGSSTEPQRLRGKIPRIFISYAREDTVWADRIHKSLGVLTRSKQLIVFMDRAIEVGDHWEEILNEAIDSCDAAVLLISGDFLNSDFIQTKELPRLFAAKEQRKIVFFPVNVRFSPVKLSKDLAQFQMFNEPDHPLNSLPDWEIDKELTRLTEEIARRLQT